MTNSEEPSAPDNLSSVTSKKNSETFEQPSRGNNSAAKAMIIGSAVNGSNNVNSSHLNGNGSAGLSDDDAGASANPFMPLPGEEETYRRETTDGWLILSNYRLYINKGKTAIYNLPLSLIEQVECRDIFFIHIHCKDARYIRCTFSSNEVANSVLKTLQRAVSVPSDITESFAFTFFEKSQSDEDIKALLGTDIPEFPSAKERFDAEIKRMEFNLKGPWRISEENVNYELCSSYPQHIIVPCMMDKKKLEEVANFRSARRIPAVVWRHRRNGAVISRCSQPEVGWFGWRSSADEELVQNIVHACADNGCPPSSVESHQHSSARDEKSGVITIQETPSSLSMELVPEAPSSKKLLILDARSYTTAVANRARGGGCECLEYYANCEIQFMNLANIHSIRKSFINMRQLCAMPADQPNWYSQLEGCKWLQHMSGLMKAALMIVSAVETEGRPVMVHCSDGWDRTPQMVSLAEILLDPYYRSIEGFQILVEREWLDFGHKFGDRCGQAMASDDANERCPVFLQWLDCLHQLLRQFPSAFEFNLSFLLKLAQHTYSNLFGTFLCNTARERESVKISQKTHSVWKFLRSQGNIHKFQNNLYVSCDKVLWPSSEVRDLVLWSHVYLGYENPVLLPTEVVNISQESSPAPSVAADGENSERLITCGQLKTKTRSYENLHTPHSEGLQRRQSDPSLKDSFCASPSCECDVSCGNAERMLAKAAEDVSLPATPDPSDTSVSFTSRVNARFSTGDDSENEDGEPNSEGRSESTVINKFRNDLKSIESSTDTLVAETGILPDFINKPACINKTEPVDLKNTDNTKSTCITEPYTSDAYLEAGICLQTSPSLVEVMSELSMASREFSAIGEGERLFKSEESNSHNPTEKYHIQSNEDFLMHSDHAGVVLTTLPNGLGLDPTCAQCEVCETSKKLLGTHSDMSGSVALNVMGNSTSTPLNGIGTVTSWHGSKYSNYNTPMHSRTPSTGIPTTPVGSEESNILTASRGRHGLETTVSSSSSSSSSSSNTGSSLSRSNFDVDGLTTLHDEIQTRVNTIVSGYKNQLDNLRMELQKTRDALMKQVGHKCAHVNLERADDAISLADSVCSGEHHSVGRESQHSHSSEFSWEAVEEKDTRPPLWLPDFAVTRCMGCDGKFWLGRRKHHCRSCGKIFCADCSERTMTIPSENIYTPVRVCMSCYHRHNSSTTQSVGPYMMSTYAAVAAGNPVSTNGHNNFHHSLNFHPQSGALTDQRLSASTNEHRFLPNEMPMTNGHSECNGVVNASSSKTKQKSMTADTINSNEVSNGHED